MECSEKKRMREFECPICCEFRSKRLTKFGDHVVEVHGKTPQDLWDELNGGRPKCACGCGGEVKWNGWSVGYSKMVVGHNGSIYSICEPEKAKEISEKRSKSLVGKASWAKGLTKENDSRISKRGELTSIGRKRSFDEGRISIWSKGLKKEDDVRLQKLSTCLRDMHVKGDIIPWAKGLTKKSDERVAKMASRVSLTCRQKSIRERLDEMKRLPTEEIKRRIEESGDLEVIGLENYVNDMSKVIVVRCKKCGQNFQGSLRMFGKGRCYGCSPGGSLSQENIAKYIESLGLTVIRNDRKKISLELDVFIPQKNVAIEYNGLYWHCHINKSPNYHSNKSKLANDSSVKLIHIFEDEWRDKNEIVKSIIMSKLGECKNRIGARECEVAELSPQQRNEFFEKNHLDGDVKASSAWGLFKNGEIVYAISLRKPFHNKHKKYLEVARCCPVIGASVAGGLSRLIKTAKEHCENLGYQGLITYVDTRLGGQGVAYEKAGFKRIEETISRWWWTDFTHRFNRFKFKANSQEGKSEMEVAQEAGVVKIWGCENIFFRMDV